MSDFDRLVNEVMSLWWRFSPVSATFAGVHEYDRELDDVSREFVLDGIRQHKALLCRLAELSPAGLTPEQALDRELLTDNLKAGIAGLEEHRLWERDPAGPVQTGIYGIFALAIREFAPLEERAAAMLARLKQVPRVIEQGRANLADSPEVFTRVAIDVTRGGIGFYQGFLPVIADQVPQMKAEMLDACRKASEALEEYERFLREEYLADSHGSFAVGRRLFDFMLRHSHGLDLDADKLVEIAEDVLAETEQALDKLAAELAPGREWAEACDVLKREHPSGHELLDVYRTEMLRARDFTRENGLVTMPESEELELIWTPAFERSTLPYAAYMRPAPLEKEQKGFFYVTPVNERLSPEKQEEQLQGHSRFKIPVTALHEGYPGHHLQLCLANRAGSDVRKLLGTSVFAEGWALYCEEMMYEQGFYDDPGVRLMQLRDQVWRGCRVLIDVGLHTQGMTFDQAVDLLVRRARLERVNAETEVKRYCLTPTQPMSYIIGKQQIMALRYDYEVKLGARFDLRAFHDKLLSFGTIPVAHVRRAMMAD